MERISISLEEELVAQFEHYLKQRGYRNRSEAIRDLIRDRLEEERIAERRSSHCVGTLSYVFNHEERELARRLTHAQHHHHDVAISTLHVHLDHDNCLETVVVNGPTEQVEAFANRIITEPGVRHGKLNLIPVEEQKQHHTHGHGAHSHRHSRPQT
ncbi:nickel-responsive transcriptional regulator NikR [Aestuariirhabdus litorea]|uniref:Putative nickel-responsive regulator n=1 Tax=Aestuariirhabdus litorea TaxID=2528527 RepID=A0A3P3VJX5_9GAMM|nr:nickel-responsive transcriptional regulator NikR [Aestuariirhabdus litorea]RRJ83031.1 nickel-responsive transcriptional regulator NikR [Aestuariirhabdus litorea]RWW93189.1 nickel-responsive transcriptional regulator NikR [Endozoicomonadaceae bacterium GTF-13]